MKDELTTAQVAEQLGASDRLVRLWCQQGRFPNARRVGHPRGDYWTIPAGDLKTFAKPKPGPVPKPTAEETTGALNKALRAATEAKSESKPKRGQEGVARAEKRQ